MKFIPNMVAAALLLFSVTLVGCDSDSADLPGTIVEVATAGGFDTLVDAVVAAELVATLESDGPFTVFAPTNAAFNKLDPATLASLLEPANKAQLADILRYHVVSGAVSAEDVLGLTSAKTVLGENVDISVENGVVSVNGAKVTDTDIEASNGIIHVIDTVLLPPAN
ncbi:MAG: fasciclin domain-containing protein [Rhodothermales bacterium]|nr:fasciclin domain-containing protein [Rhodothermales bacterium]